MGLSPSFDSTETNYIAVNYPEDVTNGTIAAMKNVGSSWVSSAVAYIGKIGGSRVIVRTESKSLTSETDLTTEVNYDFSDVPNFLECRIVFNVRLGSESKSYTVKIVASQS